MQRVAVPLPAFTVKQRRSGSSGFPAAAALLLRALLLAERMDHHPDVDLRYAKLRFRLTSHDAGGVSSRDLKMAKALEEAHQP